MVEKIKARPDSCISKIFAVVMSDLYKYSGIASLRQEVEKTWDGG